MTDSPHRSTAGWGEQRPPGDSGNPDPAYASQAAQGVPYQPSIPAPTRELPVYSEYGGYGETNGHFGPPPPSDVPGPPGPPRRWLWVLAAVSVLVVIGLVVALVIVGSAEQAVVAPAPPTTQPSTTAPSSPRTAARSPAPMVPALPFPLPRQTNPTAPGQQTVPGQTETVGYAIDGTGRAMSITYVDSGGVLQTEFNVSLPWGRRVELAKPAKSSASVTIINFGHEIACSVTVSGRVVDHRTGSGLTICGGRG